MTDGVRIEGYASVFGAVDQGSDVVAAGAYARSLAGLKAAGRAVKMLWQHDPREPIGVWDEVREDARGLHVKGRILTDVARGPRGGGADRGRRHRRAVDRLPHGAATKDAGGRRVLAELDLWEVSLVTFPMLPAARVGGAKGDDVGGAGADRLTRWAELIGRGAAGGGRPLSGRPGNHSRTKDRCDDDDRDEGPGRAGLARRRDAGGGGGGDRADRAGGGPEGISGRDQIETQATGRATDHAGSQNHHAGPAGPGAAAAAEAPHQKAFAAYVRSGDDDALRGLALEGKALNTAVAGEGGYLVDPQTSERIATVLGVDRLAAAGGQGRACRGDLV